MLIPLASLSRWVLDRDCTSLESCDLLLSFLGLVGGSSLGRG